MAAPSAVAISPELADAALSCAALTRARRLAGWVGSGRTLTASGVLRPAEATQACRDLGIELPGPRLRSALDVEELMRDWVTAAAAGFLEIDGRRARAAPDLSDAGSSTRPEPGGHPGRLGPGRGRPFGSGRGAVRRMPDCAARAARGGRTAHHGTARERGRGRAGAGQGVPCPGCGQVHGPADLLGLVDSLGDEEEDQEDTAGHAAGTVTGLVAFGAADADDRVVRLTPLGTVLAESVFAGRTPSPHADAGTVVSATSELPPPVARTVARPWLSARSAAGAARELLAFAESHRRRPAGRGAGVRQGTRARCRRWLAGMGEAARGWRVRAPVAEVAG